MIYRWLGRLVYLGLYFYWQLILIGSRRVYVVFIDSRGRLLLVKNWLGTGRWHLPGGGCRPRESFLSAARREIREEIAVDLADLSLKHLVDKRYRGRRCAIYSCRLEKPLKFVLNKRELVEAQWLKTSRSLKLDRVAALAVEYIKL